MAALYTMILSLGHAVLFLCFFMHNILPFTYQIYQLDTSTNNTTYMSKYNDKWRTYFITFLAYAALHAMRMTYSEIKPDFQKSFGESDLFLGVLDATAYISLGIGFFFRFILQGSFNIIHTYVIYIMIASIGYLVIPVISLIAGENVQNEYMLKYILPAFGLLLFGFCQFGAWPTLLSLTNSRFNIKKEGKALGIWSATGDFGDIIGFGLTGVLVDNMGYKWQISVIISGAFNMLIALVVLAFVQVRNKQKEPAQGTQQGLIADQTKEEKEVNANEEGSVESKSKFRLFLQFSRQFVKPLSNKLYLMGFSLLKCILYGFLLWMPTYLNNVGFKDYKSTIPIAFNVGTLLGSFLLGHFYEQSESPQTVKSSSLKKHFKRFALFYCCILLSGTFIIFYLIDPNVPAYFVLSGISGALLGGCFNMFSSNEVITLTGGKTNELQMLATLSMSVGNTVLGIVELLIGVVLNVKGDADASKKLFLILIGVSLLTIVVLFIRSRVNKASKDSISSVQRMSLKQ